MAHAVKMNLPATDNAHVHPSAVGLVEEIMPYPVKRGDGDPCQSRPQKRWGDAGLVETEHVEKKHGEALQLEEKRRVGCAVGGLKISVCTGTDRYMQVYAY